MISRIALLSGIVVLPAPLAAVRVLASPAEGDA